jgi:DNA polymerase, archaea type
MQIRFYAYEFDYKFKEGLPYIYLYGKLQDGNKICVIQQFQPYFYAKIDDIDEKELERRLKNLEVEAKIPAKVTKWEKVEKKLLGKEEKFWKISVNYPQAVPIISKELESWGINCYEKDIVFIHRYLRDNNLAPMTLLEAEGELTEDNNLRVTLFKANKVKQISKESLDNPKILAIDIETYNKEKVINPEKNPILMIAFYGTDEQGKEFKKVITWKKFKHQQDYLEILTDETEMLKKFREIVLDYNPDIITGYFSDGFDLPYIKSRADKYKIKLDIGIDRSEIETGMKNYSRDGKTKIKGILHLDIFKFIRYIFGKNLKTDGYSLDAVSEELLGNKKHDVNIEELAHVWDNQDDQGIEDFCKYNLHDAHLTLKLCLKLFPDVVEFSKIVGLPVFDLIRMGFSRLVESYILKHAFEKNVIAPNKPKNYEIEQRSEETYQGAFVYEPTPGMYENILVFDFKSLYPTIITSHNIGPESLHCHCCKKLTKVPEKEEYWFCVKEKKFIPQLLEQLILRRSDVKKMIKESKSRKEDTKMLEARSYALKLLANSFYGYLGFFGARWYCIECARSTTAYARNYIKDTIKKAEERNFEIVYGDTDSLFILLGDQQIENAMEFMDEINSSLPGSMELEYEGRFPRGIFVAIKGTDKGAKKKYALIDEDNHMKITGFETVRRNWSAIAKEVQEKVLRLVLEDKIEEAINYVREMIKELKNGKIDLNKLIIKTQITKPLTSYSSIGPHVAVALRMLEKGTEITPGTIVQYIIGKGSGLIRERAKMYEEIKPGEYDADYYLNNQVLPAVLGIFSVLGYKEDDLVGESSQTGLGKFF